MKISKAILTYLRDNGVENIYGVPAGTVSSIFDATNDVDIQPIIAKNEAGAAYMAARYASVSRRLGVCIGAGGVGANNMVNGVADAMRAKAPVLVITGYVNRWQVGKGALQELDTKDIFKPITKYSATLMDERTVLKEVESAVQLALTPPQGPVHLSIPIDVQLAETVEPIPDSTKGIEITIPFDREATEKAARLIDMEKYGLIMVGKGCRGMSEEVMELSRHLQWPMITTPEAKGVVHTGFELNLGNYGHAGTDAAIEFLENGPATCLLVLGSSLGECSTGNFSESLVKDRKIIHVDWDPKELGKVYDTDVKVNGDLREVISYLKNNTRKAQSQFIKHQLNSPYTNNHSGLSLQLFFDRISEVLDPKTFYVCDLGEYMNFVFKYLHIPEEGDFEINLNYAAMGSGIGGAIGVQMVDRSRPVAVFSGDGSFFMNGTEILTAKEYNLPIMYFVINNAMLGYVEHGHQFLFGRVVEGFKQERISIAAMMEAAGVKSMQINKIEDILNIPSFISNLEGPCLIELNTDGSEAPPIMERLKALKKE